MTAAGGESRAKLVDLTPFLKAFQAHQWVLLAALIVGGLVALSKQGWFSTWLAKKLPPQYVPLYALGVSVLTIGSGDIIAGKTPVQVVMDVCSTVMVAIVGHQVIIESFRRGKEIVPERTPTLPPSSSGNFTRDEQPTKPDTVVISEKKDSLMKRLCCSAIVYVMFAITSMAFSSLAAFDAAIAQGSALVAPAVDAACELATDLDPSGATAVCTYLDAAGNAAGVVFATLPTDAAAVSALLKTTPAKTPAVSQVLAAGHTMILAKKVGATVTTVSAGRK